MAIKVLVGYSSKYGATAGIAEKIGETLRKAGLEEDVLPVNKVKDLKPYGAFVIGSPLYMFHWRGDALSFLKNNRKLLAEKPTWVFSSGPLAKGDAAEQVKTQSYIKVLQPLIEEMKIRDSVAFHGAVDIDKMNFFERAVMKKMPEQIGDFRDWNIITAWADKIAAELKQ